MAAKELWVSKFGGTSLANAKQIQKVKDIIASDERRRIVVVSAPGKEHKEDEKITDLLYQCHRLVERGESIDKPFGIIRKRFLDIAQSLQAGSQVKDELDWIYEQIPREKTPDFAASRGEYLNGLMIAELLGAQFIDASEVIGLTDDGQVDESSYERCAARFNDPHAIYVLSGFYGSDPSGKVKTFTRGGSDISGAIAARSVGADLYENWTDVSGLLTADPRIVEDAQVVRNITYREIRELASIGANVFHEEAIAPVRKAGIPIQIKNTNDPLAPGTKISSDRDVSSQPIVGVSGKMPYYRVIIEKFMLSRYPEFPAQVRELFSDMGLRSDVTLSGFDSIALYVDAKQADWDSSVTAKRIEQELEADACEITGPLALIGVVGEGIPVTAGLFEQVPAALRKSGIETVSITAGNSPLSLLVSVAEADYRKALAALVQAVR